MRDEHGLYDWGDDVPAAQTLPLTGVGMDFTGMAGMLTPTSQSEEARPGGTRMIVPVDLVDPDVTGPAEVTEPPDPILWAAVQVDPTRPGVAARWPTAPARPRTPTPAPEPRRRSISMDWTRVAEMALATAGFVAVSAIVSAGVTIIATASLIAGVVVHFA